MSGVRSSLTIISVMILIAACGGGGDATSDETTDSTTTTMAAAPSTTEMTSHGEDTHDEEDGDHEDQSSDQQESSDHDDDTMGSADRTIEVSMTEFAFEPAQVEVTGGETVRFVITNNGLVDHEFRLSNAHRIEEHLAEGHEDHGDEGGHHEEGGDVFIVLKPGEAGELVMTFPEDATLYTEMTCLLPGHYEAGMTGPVMYGDA